MNEFERRFNHAVDKFVMPVPWSGCWVWMGALSSTGYANINIAKKRYSAHRVAWMVRNGPIPEGKFVCHTCDVPACVNPDHLFLGTHKDNMADRHAKGRTYRVIDDEAAEMIRILVGAGVSAGRVAGKFGISQTQAARIAKSG